MSSKQRLLSRSVLFLSLAALTGLQLGSQSSTAAISITGIPNWGQDGEITGFVYGVNATQVGLYIFEFIPDVGWVQIPGCAPVQIQGTGQFSISVTQNILGRYATRFTAYLVPTSVGLQCASPVPAIAFVIEHNAVARASIPRIPQYHTLSFGGLDWYIKTSPVKVDPGPQFFVDQNAFVDQFGQLHLKLTRCSDTWCAAEIYTRQTVGYGTYKFSFNSQLNNLDPNVTLGLFTWDAQANEQFNREWDIEFARWGNSSAPFNTQFVVQPYTAPGNLNRFLMSPSATSTHTVNWSPGQINFASVAGNGAVVNQWTYTGGSPVPTPGDVHLHLNFYLAAGPNPSNMLEQEIVISGFQYVPSGPQIGFGRVSDTVQFPGSAYAVPIMNSGTGCSAFVESDSPWIAVTGANPYPPVGPLLITWRII